MEENLENSPHQKKKNTFSLDSLVNFIFSNDPRKWLVLILILGVVLRIIVASNVEPIGDEAVHGPHAIGFLHSGLISTILECPLWFYLTDIAMNFLGITVFSTRFLSVFYGSLSLIVVYLIASKIFNKKVGLISAFLLSVSFFTIRYTLAEMDLAALFFLLLAVYFFIESSEKSRFIYVSAICIGIASLIKTLSLFFVPAFIIGFFLLNRNKEKKFKKIIIKIILFSVIILIFFSPILIHNYLWYVDKQMVDTYFAQYFDIGNARAAYSGQLGFSNGLFSMNFFAGFARMSKSMFFLDPIILIAGILGFILSFYLNKDRKTAIFLLLFEAFGFILLLIASNWLETHYTTLIPILCIYGGFFIYYLSEKISSKYQIKLNTILIIILSLILIFQIYMLMPYLTSKCGTSQMRDYAISSIDKNSIVVTDGRIYRGRVAWMFNDFHYLEASLLPDILTLNQNYSGQYMPIKLYFIECTLDDCGWGTIKDQPNFNKSMEEMAAYFSSLAEPEKIIYVNGNSETSGQNFKVYQTQISINPSLISVIDSTHTWFYYPLNYGPKSEIFDTYVVDGFFNIMLYKIAWIIIYLSIFLAITLPIIIFYYLIKHK